MMGMGGRDAAMAARLKATQGGEGMKPAAAAGFGAGAPRGGGMATPEALMAMAKKEQMGRPAAGGDMAAKMAMAQRAGMGRPMGAMAGPPPPAAPGQFSMSDPAEQMKMAMAQRAGMGRPGGVPGGAMGSPEVPAAGGLARMGAPGMMGGADPAMKMAMAQRASMARPGAAPGGVAPEMMKTAMSQRAGMARPGGVPSPMAGKLPLR